MLDPNGHGMETDQDLERWFEVSLDMICIAGIDGYFKRIDPAFSEILGREEADLLRAPWLDFVHPDDRDLIGGELRKLAAGAPATAFENRWRCADGSYRWLAWRVAPAPSTEFLFGVVRDLTEQKRVLAILDESEARLRAVFDNAVEGFVVVDAAGTIETFNPAAEKIFGYRAAEVIGRNVSMLMPEPYRSAHDGYIQRYCRTREAHVIGIEREVTGQRKDGSVFPLDLGLAAFDLGERTLFLGSVRDISERKQAEQAAADLIAQEAHQRGVLATAAGFLHDLGNLLTGIGTLSQDAKRHLIDQVDADHLKRTAGFLKDRHAKLAEALGEDKAAALIDLLVAMEKVIGNTRSSALGSLDKVIAYVTHAQELLATHYIYSGATSGATPERVEVGTLLEDARLLLADAVAKRGGQLDVRIDGEPPPLRAARSRLMQVLLNLGKNAIEACDGAAIAPRLTLAATHVPGACVRIEVADNGPGFAPEAAARLFEAGYSTKGRGSGLGLATARQLIRSLQGDLSLTSAGPGRGTRAVIELPEQRA